MKYVKLSKKVTRCPLFGMEQTEHAVKNYRYGGYKKRGGWGGPPPTQKRNTKKVLYSQ